MVLKLLKYENKALSKLFLPFSCGLLIVALFMSFSFEFGVHERFTVITITIYLVALFVLVFATLFLTGKRFYTHMFQDQGYLTNTLPVASWKHLLVKGVSATFWMGINGLIGMYSVYIFFESPFDVSGFTQMVLDLFSTNASYYKISEGIMFLLNTSILVTFGMLLAFMIYFAVSLTQGSSRFALVKLAVTLVGEFLLFTGVSSMVADDLSHALYWFAGGKTLDVFDYRFYSFIQSICLLILFLVFAILFFFLTNFLLKRPVDIK